MNKIIYSLGLLFCVSALESMQQDKPIKVSNNPKDNSVVLNKEGQSQRKINTECVCCGKDVDHVMKLYQENR